GAQPPGPPLCAGVAHSGVEVPSAATEESSQVDKIWNDSSTAALGCGFFVDRPLNRLEPSGAAPDIASSALSSQSTQSTMSTIPLRNLRACCGDCWTNHGQTFCIKGTS